MDSQKILEYIYYIFFVIILHIIISKNGKVIKNNDRVTY